MTAKVDFLSIFFPTRLRRSTMESGEFIRLLKTDMLRVARTAAR